jgi:hypothetical protein
MTRIANLGDNAPDYRFRATVTLKFAGGGWKSIRHNGTVKSGGRPWPRRSRRHQHRAVASFSEQGLGPTELGLRGHWLRARPPGTDPLMLSARPPAGGRAGICFPSIQAIKSVVGYNESVPFTRKSPPLTVSEGGAQGWFACVHCRAVHPTRTGPRYRTDLGFRDAHAPFDFEGVRFHH